MEEEQFGLQRIGDILSHTSNEEPTLPSPPFDSPIEQEFANCCFGFLSPVAAVEKQVEIFTSHGRFRLDFLITINGRRIAVECDGKDFHEGSRDELRDAILLGGGHCDTIYHFRGCDLVYYPYYCIWLMSVLDKDLFSQRGRIQLPILRTSEVNVTEEQADINESFILNIDPPTRFVWVFRRSVSLASKHPDLNYFWKVLYSFACEHPHASMDELLQF